MTHIKKMKTWYGLRYAVVEPFCAEHYVVVGKDENGKPIKELKRKIREFAVEYKEGRDIKPALFPVTPEGLKEAKDLQKMLNK